MTYITLCRYNTGLKRLCRKNVRMEWGGRGGDRSVSSSAGPWGTLVGTFQAGFTVAMKTAAGARTHIVSIH